MINLKVLFLILVFLGLTACDSNVFTTEDQKALALKQELDSPPSSFEVILNTGLKQQISCSPQNSFKAMLNQNSKKRIYCREKTRLAEGLSAGAVCAEGVILKDFTSESQWLPCEELTLCGEKVSLKTDLKSKNELSLLQLEWNQLPWGCQGKIETALEDELESIDKIKSFDIKIEAPLCPLCEISGVQTCQVCGVDSGKPNIIDVFSESYQCNEIRLRVFAQDEQGLHKEAYSFDKGLTWQADSTKVYQGLELNLPIEQIWVRDRSSNIAKYNKVIESTSSPCPCETPWKETIAHGVSLKVYTASAVNCSTTCEANSGTRICNNGVFSGDAKYVAKTCQVTGCAACTLPWSGTIQHGEKVDAYNLSTAPCAGKCQKATLTCDKGLLLGGVETYKFKACNAIRPNCDCAQGGIIISNGAEKKLFAAAEVACDQTCQESTIKCVDGLLDGNTTYTSLSCSPKVCQCKTSWGQLLNKNEAVDAFKVSSLTCEQGMSCDAAQNKIRIQCTDPIKNQIDIIQGTGVLAEFNKQTCSIASCGCSHLGNIIKEGQKLKVYKIEEALPPIRCETEGNSGEVQCVKSGSTFRLTGDTNVSIYKYTECQNKEIPGTGTGVGSSPSDVGVGTGGGAGGGTGNSEGDGDGFKRRASGGGSGCDINSPPYYCLGGSANVSVKTSWCLLPTLDGYSAAATNDTDFRHRVQPGANLTLYSRKQVTCGDSCQNYQRVVACDLGVMTEKSIYKYLDCREVCP